MAQRSAALVALALAASSCVEAPMAPPALTAADFKRCGVQSAMSVRSEEWEKDRPRACALPTSQMVAQHCAIHDHVRSPGYRPLEQDEFGDPIMDDDAQPTPVYQVTNLSCAYTNTRENEADCSFKLQTPDSGDRWLESRIIFEHSFYQDHGPAHHIYGTNWWPIGSCKPAAPTLSKRQ